MTKPGDVLAGDTSEPTKRAPVTNARGRAKRERILEIAKEHFGQGGYRGVSTAAIAAEVGITDPGLLHHFQNKAGLLMELLESRFGRDDEILSIDDNTRGVELLEKLDHLVAENETNRADVRLFSVLLAESVAENHPSHEYFAQRYKRARGLLSAYLRDAQERGVIKADVDSESLASALLALMDGLQYQWLIDDSFSMAAAFRTMSSLVAQALVESPGSPSRQDDSSQAGYLHD